MESKWWGGLLGLFLLVGEGCEAGARLRRPDAPECPGGCEDTSRGCRVNGRCVIPVEDPSGTPVCVYDEALDGTACALGGGVTGQCSDGTCQECTGPAVCNDGVGCTRDLCVAGACVSVDECAPTCDGGCPATLAAGCKVNGRCDGTVCTYDNALDGKACAVTPGLQGVCAAGSCVECVSAAQCNDGIACTTDGCSNGSCVHVDGCQTGCGPDGAACTLPTGAGVCSGGVCVQCLSDGQCADGLVCTLDACSAGFCQNELKHDSVAWRLAPPSISPEILVSASHSRVADVEWNGTDFVVFMSGGGGKVARRVRTDGTVLDGPSGWTLPGGFIGAAAGGGKLLFTMAEDDPTYGGTLVKYQLYSPEGAPLGTSRSLDLDCRDPTWSCYGAEPYFGGNAFLLLYNKEWRTQYYGLVDLSGGGRAMGKVSSAQSGYTSAGHASFDGQKFVTAWHDYTRVSNSSDIGLTRISPAGTDPYLPFHALTADADQNTSNIKANVSALGGRALVLFEGPSGQGQVVDASFNAVGPRLSGFGNGSALSEPLYADHDGTNFLVVAVGADRIVGTRVDANGNKLDPTPFPISGADASREHYPRIVRGAGVFLVAYTKRDSPSGVYAALVTTCP